MKTLFSLLMLGFMLILVAPVQAMQAVDQNYYQHYAPPGICVPSIDVIQMDIADVPTVYNLRPIALLPELEYAALTRDSVAVIFWETIYKELSAEPPHYRKPRDSL